MTPRPAATATLVLLAGLGGGALPARADFEPTGAVTTGFLLGAGGSAEGRAYGGGLAVDLWHRFGVLRTGFYTGLQFVRGAQEDAIAFTPLAASLAVALEAERATFEIRLRGGGYGAVLHRVGLSGGLYLGTGIFLDVKISERASLGLGGELHLLVLSEHGSRSLFSPSLTLVYRPGADDAP